MKKEGKTVARLCVNHLGDHYTVHHNTAANLAGGCWHSDSGSAPSVPRISRVEQKESATGRGRISRI